MKKGRDVEDLKHDFKLYIKRAIYIGNRRSEARDG